MGLRLRLFLILVVPMCLAIGGYGWVRLQQEESQLLTEEKRRMELTATALQVAVENALRDRQFGHPPAAGRDRHLPGRDRPDPGLRRQAGVAGRLEGPHDQRGGARALAPGGDGREAPGPVLRAPGRPAGALHAGAAARTQGRAAGRHGDRPCRGDRGRPNRGGPVGGRPAGGAAGRGPGGRGLVRRPADGRDAHPATGDGRERAPGRSAARRSRSGAATSSRGWGGRSTRWPSGCRSAPAPGGRDGARLDLARQVRQAEKLAVAGRLASEVAHEIGTPLNVISGRAEYVLRDLPPDHPAAAAPPDHRRPDRPHQRDHRLAPGLVRPRKAEVQDVELRPLLAPVLELLEPTARKKGLASPLDLPADLRLRADPNQLQQVAINLLVNAIEATPAGGRVDVRARPRPAGTRDRARLEVVDRGPASAPRTCRGSSIPSSPPSRRAGNRARARDLPGHRREHGGTIELASAPGAGTSVRVWLPAA